MYVLYVVKVLNSMVDRLVISNITNEWERVINERKCEIIFSRSFTFSCIQFMWQGFIPLKAHSHEDEFINDTSNNESAQRRFIYKTKTKTAGVVFSATPIRISVAFCANHIPIDTWWCQQKSLINIMAVSRRYYLLFLDKK